MQLEIEMKTKIKNKKRLLAKFALLGIRNRSKAHFIDIYFSPRKGKRFVLVNSPKLRIRKNLTAGTATFEYHLPSGVYCNQEREIEVSDGDMMDVILKQLGFIEEVRIDKVRTFYDYKNFNIYIDQVKGLGNFLEVEIMNATNKKAAVKKIKQLLKDLCVKDDIVRSWYWQMMLKKNNKL
jgi:adenylate cyclase, class 2